MTLSTQATMITPATRPKARTGWRRLLPDLARRQGEDLNPRSLMALALLLLLVQLPHLTHLPLWVSVAGITMTGLRLVLSMRPDQRWLDHLLCPVSVTLLAVLAAWLIRMDYGYFIGRDPCVAFLFLLVAAKFAEVRRSADATLLLCLAAFLLLTQYFYSQTILAALITLPAVLALAHALLVLRDPTTRQSTGERLRLVLTLLAQGLPLAALLFLVFPRLPGPLWSLPEDASASTGLSDTMSPGTIGSLSLSDAVAFRVEFDGAVPAPRDRYWRGPVLNEFDGRRWSSSRRRLAADVNYRGDQREVLDYTVTLQPHRQRWLFALDAAVSLPSDGGAEPLARLMSDGQLIAHRAVNQPLRYRQQSVLIDAMRTPAGPASGSLQLPGVNQRSRDFAQALRERHDSDADYVRAVLQHFRRAPFRYTLQPQLLGDAPVDEFLFDTQQGFCEHYAAAFVVLMRSAGIPARVVTGYQGGEMNEDYMIVRQSDAHAWAEAWLDGAWRRFDPTAAVAPSRVDAGLAAALPGESSVPRLARLDRGWFDAARLRWDALNHQWQRWVIDFDNDSQDGLWQRLGLSTPALWQITLLVLTLTGLWALLLLGLPARERREMTPDEQLWQQLCRRLRAHRLIRRPTESATDYLNRAALAWPARASELQELDRQLRHLRFRSIDTSEAARRRDRVRRLLRRLRWSRPDRRHSRSADKSLTDPDTQTH